MMMQELKGTYEDLVAVAATWHWSNPIRRLRKELGLPTNCDPIFRDKFLADLVLALFSQWLAKKQRDWPVQMLQPGSVYFEGGKTETNCLPELEALVAGGDAPIVFTHGSTAVHNRGDFYLVSAEAARHLGRRAVLLGIKSVARSHSTEILELPYAPYSWIFPRGVVNGHQGGSGTVGEALRAGRPILVVPYGWDQPDNAARVQRLGAGLHLPRREYSVKTAVRALRRLLDEPKFETRAAKLRIKWARRRAGNRVQCDRGTPLIEVLLDP
jgi:rhamnosyltransferase subunit B